MGEVIVKILLMFGGWGWITVGAIIVVGWTIIFVVYLCDWQGRQAFLYSLRNYVAVTAVGLLAIVFGVVQLWPDKPSPKTSPPAAKRPQGR
jgi:hypothetical protein